MPARLSGNFRCYLCKTISDTRVSASWELLECRLFLKWWFLAEIVFSASRCWKVNGFTWKKEKKKRKPNPASLTYPSNGNVSLHRIQIFSAEGCVTTCWRQEDSGKRGFQPASSPPPSHKSTLESSHWFLNCVLKFLWVNTALIWHPYNANEIQESWKCSWIYNVLFSDSLWIGRSHFSQDGEDPNP